MENKYVKVFLSNESITEAAIRIREEIKKAERREKRKRAPTPLKKRKKT